ncbi:helicases [Striga asiatica]|uniref:Helicases n=1 Tax=Striga asiatica TaxID=4170 RepID=A0A5A7RB76_STRAF|nr:helicases [Striga asiatica]
MRDQKRKQPLKSKRSGTRTLSRGSSACSDLLDELARVGCGPLPLLFSTSPGGVIRVLGGVWLGSVGLGEILQLLFWGLPGRVENSNSAEGPASRLLEFHPYRRVISRVEQSRREFLSLTKYPQYQRFKKLASLPPLLWILATVDVLQRPSRVAEEPHRAVRSIAIAPRFAVNSQDHQQVAFFEFDLHRGRPRTVGDAVFFPSMRTSGQASRLSQASLLVGYCGNPKQPFICRSPIVSLNQRSPVRFHSAP